MATINVTDATFEDDVLRSERPVLVDFWAPWCGPCRAVAPILEELSETFASILTIAKVNTDENPRISAALRIQSIPTMILFEGGRPTQAVQGALPKEELVARIKQWVRGASGPSITVDGLAAIIDAGQPVAIFDLRRELDFGRSHLLGAKCVDPDKLEEALQDVLPGTAVVLMCRTGEISLEKAKAIGGVQALEKGLLEWEGSGRPTYSNKEEARIAVDAT